MKRLFLYHQLMCVVWQHSLPHTKAKKLNELELMKQLGLTPSAQFMFEAGQLLGGSNFKNFETVKGVIGSLIGFISCELQTPKQRDGKSVKVRKRLEFLGTSVIYDAVSYSTSLSSSHTASLGVHVSSDTIGVDTLVKLDAALDFSLSNRKGNAETSSFKRTVVRCGKLGFESTPQYTKQQVSKWIEKGYTRMVTEVIYGGHVVEVTSKSSNTQENDSKAGISLQIPVVAGNYSFQTSNSSISSRESSTIIRSPNVTITDGWATVLPGEDLWPVEIVITPLEDLVSPNEKEDVVRDIASYKNAQNLTSIIDGNRSVKLANLDGSAFLAVFRKKKNGKVIKFSSTVEATLTLKIKILDGSCSILAKGKGNAFYLDLTSAGLKPSSDQKYLWNISPGTEGYTIQATWNRRPYYLSSTNPFVSKKEELFHLFPTTE